MASGTRTRARGRSAARGRAAGSASPTRERSAQRAVAQQQITLALRPRPGQAGSFRLQRLVLVELADATALRAERSRQPLPVALVRDALEVDGIRLESAQIVLHTQPAPALNLPQQSVAVSNYLPLQEQTGAPAVRITWIALKFDPELC